jgi:regulator of nucleoside diphosphate kinase
MAAVLLSVYDFHRLSLLLRKYRDSPFRERMALNRLEEKLERAVLLPPEQIASNIVTLCSTVKVTDLASRKQNLFTLVFPKETAHRGHRISILAPIGIALLGERVGSRIECRAPEKTLRLRIDELIFQPEAAGACYA